MQLLRWNNLKPIQGHDTRPASSPTERGWMSRKSPPSGRRRSIFLTSPFIDQAITRFELQSGVLSEMAISRQSTKLSSFRVPDHSSVTDLLFPQVHDSGNP